MMGLMSFLLPKLAYCALGYSSQESQSCDSQGTFGLAWQLQSQSWHRFS